MKKTLIFLSRFPLLFAAVALLSLVSVCSTPDSRIKANPEAFTKLTPDQQTLVRAGHVAIGMDQEAVKLALGDPDRITERTDASGKTESWHYVTYEDNGMPLYTGYYHHAWGRGMGYRAAWGGWGWGGYPYYMDYPNRTVRDRIVVDIKNGEVAAINQES